MISMREIKMFALELSAAGCYSMLNWLKRHERKLSKYLCDKFSFQDDEIVSRRLHLDFISRNVCFHSKNINHALHSTKLYLNKHRRRLTTDDLTKTGTVGCGEHIWPSTFIRHLDRCLGINCN